MRGRGKGGKGGSRGSARNRNTGGDMVSPGPSPSSSRPAGSPTTAWRARGGGPALASASSGGKAKVTKLFWQLGGKVKQAQAQGPTSKLPLLPLTRKAAELAPLKLAWPKPCIGICQWKLLQVQVLHGPWPGRHQGGGLRPGQDHGRQAPLHRPLLPQEDVPGGQTALVQIYYQPALRN